MIDWPAWMGRWPTTIEFLMYVCWPTTGLAALYLGILLERLRQWRLRRRRVAQTPVDPSVCPSCGPNAEIGGFDINNRCVVCRQPRRARPVQPYGPDEPGMASGVGDDDLEGYQPSEAPTAIHQRPEFRR